MVAEITTPYRERHPNVRFTILSRTSAEVLALLENLEIDAGVTYLDNEPLGRVTAVPFYEERYRLITSLGSPLGDRESVTWAEVGSVPLCLLTPDMQNRRIIDRLLLGGRRAGDADAGIELRHRALLACPHRTLGERHAGEAREHARADRSGALDPDRGAGSGAHGRAGRAAPRADDSAGAGAGRRGQASCRAAHLPQI